MTRPPYWTRSRLALDSALIAASAAGRPQRVKALLDAGANVHAGEDDALRWASVYGHAEVVKILLDAGADMHARHDFALRYASLYGHTETVKLLEAAQQERPLSPLPDPSKPNG